MNENPSKIFKVKSFEILKMKCSWEDMSGQDIYIDLLSHELSLKHLKMKMIHIYGRYSIQDKMTLHRDATVLP